MSDVIALDRVVFDDSTRIRQDLDSAGIRELAESISKIGLINPIVIDRDNKLIAGRRRLEATKVLGLTEIAFRYFDTLDELDKLIVEYDENSKRKQLTWQEDAKAIADIHHILAERHAAESRPSDSYVAEDTADALNISAAKVREALQLSSVLDNERIAGRPTKKGALTTMRRERELTLVRELARRRMAEMGVTQDGTQFAMGRVINADCRSVLRGMAENSVDLIVVDPPWGIDLDKASQWTSKWTISYDDSEKAVRDLLTESVPLMYRVLKPASHIYCFFPVQRDSWWADLFDAAGFVTRQRPLVWFKTGQQGISDVYTSFLPSYETALWGYKPGEDGVRRFFSRPIPEGFAFPRQPGLWHENEKPIELIEKWIEASSEPGETVLDCFAGGGSTLATAFQLGRYYIGIEKDAVNYEKCTRRLREMEEVRVDDRGEIGGESEGDGAEQAGD